MKKNFDKWLEENLVLVGFGLMALNFGFWQKSFNAGGFVLITCTTLHLLYRKHRLDRWEEKEFDKNVRMLAQEIRRKRWREQASQETDSVTH